MPNWIDSRFEKGLVSVIIPTYNRATFLEEALQSVWEQTYRPIECIVVDDGSTDGTITVVNNFKQKTNESFRINYLFQQNAGAQTARNKGTMASNGEFIQYLDSDDLLYKQKIEQQVSFLRQHPNIDGVFGDWNSGTPDRFQTIQAFKSENMIEQMLTGRCLHTLSLLFCRPIISQTGKWDETIARNQEVDYHLSALLAGANFEYHQLICGLWRYHEEGRIHNQTGLTEIMSFYQKWEKKLEERNLFSNQLRRNVSKWYLYLFSQYRSEAIHTKVLLLKEVIRLDPFVTFYRNPKLRLLVKLIGMKTSLKIWIRRFENVSRKSYMSKP